jgi:hypothetical protein
VGIDRADKRFWHNHESARQPSIKLPTTDSKFVAYTVTKRGVQVEIDGRLVFDWQGEPWRASAEERRLADHRKLFLACERRIMWTDLMIGPPTGRLHARNGELPAAGKAVDLVETLDLSQDVMSGKWTRDRAIQGSGRFMIPVDLPLDYKLRMRVNVKKPERPFLADNRGSIIGRTVAPEDATAELYLSLPMGSNQANAVIDLLTEGGPVTGLYLDSQLVEENSKAYRERLIPLDQVVELEIIVRPGSIKIAADGKSVVDWTGNPARLTSRPRQANPTALMAISTEKDVLFESLTLERLEPLERVLVEEIIPNANVLPLIRLDRDARKGDWTQGADGLMVPNIPAARLQIPILPPPQYTLTAIVERKEAEGDAFIVGIPVGTSPAAVLLDASSGPESAFLESALTELDGKTVGSANVTTLTHKPRLLPVGQAVTIRCHVLPDTVVLTCDDLEVIRWHGDARRLSESLAVAAPNRSRQDHRYAWVGGWNTAFLIRDLRLEKMPDEDADRLRQSFSGVYPQKFAKNVEAVLEEH